MLQLQRASAGSGKTFTLAKKFIWFLIAVRSGGSSWRLRTEREITDGLKRILAITFTNKATNEMKLRIVDKLADLSRAASGKLSAAEIKKIDYLFEFAGSFGVRVEKFGESAAMALAVLLNEYSDFKVSTIDSFFQTILRTFAYESNLNDTYQVEIDTAYIATAAVDATLDDINNATVGSTASFWLGILMDQEAASGSTRWNVFQKSDSDRSIYTLLRNSIHRLDNEEFKRIRNSLDAYFSDSDETDPLASAYTRLRDSIETPLKESLAEAQKDARTLRRMLRDNNVDPAADCVRYFASHLDKLPRLIYNQSSSKNTFALLKLKPGKTIFKNEAAVPDAAAMHAIAMRMYENYASWLEQRASSRWMHWKVYSRLLPYLGLIGETRRRMHEFLEANNTIQLGETNSMLRRIIGDDDAPFIYERLGSSINHYLIDEFQDTSRLQWDNLLPLLRESDGRGEDNLIIGDAKQSIYRFRNADPSLITTQVPSEFPIRFDAGMSKDDNTNWRSCRNIVEFNNFFFHTLMTDLSTMSKGIVNLPDLYGNVAQYPNKREHEGYVEVNFLSDTPAEGETAPQEEKADLQEIALSRMGPLVESLLQRGYNQRDIAFLVNTNQLAKDVIAALVAYNTSLPQGARRIEFISEESLLVSSSEAVGIIVSVLRKMATGSDLRFNFYAMRHPELSAAEQLRGFLREENPVDGINEMLSHMQTVALPALVEAITENFVPEDMRRTQAVFIAGLQDMVLEYCDSHASDITSFLDWWDTKGCTRSISSPEGTDAVQIMTVHKSKGLEFKCVVLPFATNSLVPGPQTSEWRWVRPASCLQDGGLPPFIPVETLPDLCDTEHKDEYERYFDLYMMDKLNSYYVAFTRAVNELYIFTKESSRSQSIGKFLRSICTDADIRLGEVSDPAARSFMPVVGFVNWNETGDVMTFGTPPVIKPEKKEKENGSVQRVIEEYGVDSSPAILQYVESEDDTTATLLPDATDPDPRSEGNLLHGIMSLIVTRDDLPKAILQSRMRGTISSAQAMEWEGLLAEALDRPEVSGWFTPGWKVYNERDILSGHQKNKRPDRIPIAPDRSRAIIIDYKFGAIPNNDSHKDQVNAYRLALREITGIKHIEGHIWYVRENRIVTL